MTDVKELLDQLAADQAAARAEYKKLLKMKKTDENKAKMFILLCKNEVIDKYYDIRESLFPLVDDVTAIHILDCKRISLKLARAVEERFRVRLDKERIDPSVDLEDELI